LAEKPGYVFMQPVWNFLRPHGMSSWCHDMLFSGHSMFYIIAALFLHDAGYHCLFWLAGWAMAATGILALICSRMHYSVDVAIAIIIAVLVYLHSRRHLVWLLADTARIETTDEEPEQIELACGRFEETPNDEHRRAC
jgi:hypothetical protein